MRVFSFLPLGASFTLFFYCPNRVFAVVILTKPSWYHLDFMSCVILAVGSDVRTHFTSSAWVPSLLVKILIEFASTHF